MKQANLSGDHSTGSCWCKAFIVSFSMNVNKFGLFGSGKKFFLVKILRRVSRLTFGGSLKEKQPGMSLQEGTKFLIIFYRKRERREPRF